MPSSVTHSYFAIDVYDTLPSLCQDRIKNNLEYLKMFSQGPDPFMFYNFFLGKKGTILQSRMHKENTNKCRR